MALLGLIVPAAAWAGGSGNPGSGGGGFSGSGGTSFLPGGSALANGNPKIKGDSRHLGDRVLREGMTGHDVRVLQAYLSFAGFGTQVDGSFGPATQQSVVAFERQQGLPGNGIVSIPLSQKLRQVVAQAAAAPPTSKTRINPDGTATAPAGAPALVQAVVAGANQIINTSYCVGGGHGNWTSSCYDCSGSVSFALHAAGLLNTSEDSTELESYGLPGPGQYITIYADASHAFMVVGGRAFDTADFGGPNIPAGTGPRWRSDPLGNLSDGGNYVVRHPAGG
ncbi:MAG: peptidoglycan-binding protein [Solirubrobacterales bacterium]|nr:peptidoglycan-binding protein [Solirubrobacterales bacterium]